jgi:hypothetical protein
MGLMPSYSRETPLKRDRHDPSEGFRFVSDNQAVCPIVTMCRALGVSPHRLLCVDEAAALTPYTGGRGADRGDPHCA